MEIERMFVFLMEEMYFQIIYHTLGNIYIYS